MSCQKTLKWKKYLVSISRAVLKSSHVKMGILQRQDLCTVLVQEQVSKMERREVEKDMKLNVTDR